MIAKIWNGQIRLWKAIVLVGLTGYLAALILSFFVATLILSLFGLSTLGMVLASLFSTLLDIAFGTVCSVCIWRASPNPKVSIVGAFSKIFAVFIGVYFSVIVVGGILNIFTLLAQNA